jgi:hypothetical protein
MNNNNASLSPEQQKEDYGKVPPHHRHTADFIRCERKRQLNSTKLGAERKGFVSSSQ